MSLFFWGFIMKKLILTIFLFLIGLGAYADDISEVRSFFDSYVNAANSYSKNYFNYYVPNAKIIRVVEKKDGTTQTVVIPMPTYKKETNKGMKMGKVARYKNTYSNINITSEGEDYRLSATRSPSPGGSFPAYFIIGKDNSGNWKIKEESMNTDVQKFLKNG